MLLLLLLLVVGFCTPCRCRRRRNKAWNGFDAVAVIGTRAGVVFGVPIAILCGGLGYVAVRM